MYAGRERRRAEPRILYWFRTPPNVRVGRAALDEEAIRSIEEHNPGLTFDWTKILKTKPPAPPPAEESPRDRRRRERAAKGRRAERSAKPAEPRRREAPAEAAPEPLAVEPAGGIEALAEHAPAVAVEAWTGPGEAPPAEAEHAALPPGLHVEERLGPEGFSRLRARYAELMARITERVQDPARLEELRIEAERLNPDTWITDEEARAGIEGFDVAYEALRARLGRRRRRSRRGGARRRRARENRAAAGATAADGATEGPADVPETPDGDAGFDAPEPAGEGEDDEPE